MANMSYKMRLPLGCVAPLLVDNIVDLLEEYGDIDDIIEML